MASQIQAQDSASGPAEAPLDEDGVGATAVRAEGQAPRRGVGKVALAVLAFLGRRVARVVAVLVTITFAVYYLVLGFRDPVGAMLGELATPEMRATLTQELGLDKPIIVQYWDWLMGALSGDLGRSIRSGQEVSSLIVERAMPTIQLGLYAVVLAVVFGMLLGVLSARSHGRLTDNVLGVVSLIGIAIPNFALALLFVLTFAVALRWLPMSGYTHFTESPAEHFELMLLPAVALSLEMMAVVTRLTRSSAVEAINSPYATAARGRGVREHVVMRRYIARAAAIPVMTFVGLRMGYLLGGAIVIETVFGIPGIGSLAADAVFQADYPVVLGVVLLAGVVVALSNIIVDLLYRVVDPRAR